MHFPPFPLICYSTLPTFSTHSSSMRGVLNRKLPITPAYVDVPFLSTMVCISVVNNNATFPNTTHPHSYYTDPSLLTSDPT